MASLQCSKETGNEGTRGKSRARKSRKEAVAQTPVRAGVCRPGRSRGLTENSYLEVIGGPEFSSV